MTETPEAQPLPRWMPYMKLRDIKPAVRNPKAHDREKMQGSINRFGFADAMIMDERTGRLVAGHGRHEDLSWREARGGPTPDGIIIDADGDWCAPVQRGWSSRDDAEAEAFLLGHNYIGQIGGWQNAELLESMEAIEAVEPHLLEIAGFADDAVDRLRALVEAEEHSHDEDDEEPPTKGSSGGGLCDRCPYGKGDL